MRSAIITAVVIGLLIAGSAMADNVPAPLYLSANAIGGAALNQYTPGVADGRGPNNIGLLIRTYGKVTFVDTVEKYFYIDDGSARLDGTVNSGTPLVGIRVSYGGLAAGVAAINPPTVNAKVTVTGIASTFLGINNSIQPNFRVRCQNDIFVLL